MKHLVRKCRDCGDSADLVGGLCRECAVRMWNRNIPTEADLALAREILKEPAMQETIRRLEGE